MSKTKSTPNLPAASRLQPPSGGGGSMGGVMKAKGGMKGSTGTTKKIMATASKGGKASKKMC
jgi:hypothetical protein